MLWQLNICLSYFIELDIHALAIDVLQEAYKSMASALSEADGIDYTDPEEVQFQ